MFKKKKNRVFEKVRYSLNSENESHLQSTINRQLEVYNILHRYLRYLIYLNDHTILISEGILSNRTLMLHDYNMLYDYNVVYS